jgi:hypothetical protein
MLSGQFSVILEESWLDAGFHTTWAHFSRSRFRAQELSRGLVVCIPTASTEPGHVGISFEVSGGCTPMTFPSSHAMLQAGTASSERVRGSAGSCG